MRSDNPPASDVALFREIAETLYGPHPADLLADALEVNIRSVQRWLAGQNQVPQPIWDKMYQLLRGAEAACQRLLGKPVGDAPVNTGMVFEYEILNSQFEGITVITETGIGKFGKDDVDAE